MTNCWTLGGILKFILDATWKYMDFYRDDQGHDGCYLHDPLAVGVAIDPSFVKMEEMKIYVETEGNCFRDDNTLETSGKDQRPTQLQGLYEGRGREIPDFLL